MRLLLSLVIVLSACGNKKESKDTNVVGSGSPATQQPSLPVEPPPPQPDAAELVRPPEGPSPEAIRKVHEEPIGGVNLGMTGEEVAKALGAPKKKSAVAELGNAKNEFGMTWTWPTMKADLASASKIGPFTLRTITFLAASKVKTSRGVGIGSTRAEVAAAYPNLAEPIMLEDKRMFVVGSVNHYGLNGIMFTFREQYEEEKGDLVKDTVKSIEWSGGAEK